MKTRPYVIVTPTYCVSAGVRVLHTLCHELNSLGLDAKLLLTSNLSPSPDKMLNPAFHTPVINHLMQDHWEQINEESIVIYADGVPGNPFGAKRIVRYVLGKEMPKPEDDPSEYRVYYSKSFPVRREAKNRTLFLLPVDLGLFNDKGVVARTQDMLWLGKGSGFYTEPIPNVVPITYQWPETRQELAAQLRRTRFLYSYDAVSSTNVEAVLCGAIVILKQVSYHHWEFSRADMEAHEATAGGFAFGDSPFEIERAIRTRQELVENLRYQQASFRQRLLDFVSETQLHFNK
ncbi:hypothetical protein ACFJGW_15560 [Burkholderiaceae bacterium UC74_6]